MITNYMGGVYRAPKSDDIIYGRPIIEIRSLETDTQNKNTAYILFLVAALGSASMRKLSRGRGRGFKIEEEDEG